MQLQYVKLINNEAY